MCGFSNGAAIGHVHPKPYRLWRLAFPNIAVTDKRVNPILLPFRHSHYFSSSGSLGVHDRDGKSPHERRGGATQDARNLPYRRWHMLHTRGFYHCINFPRNITFFDKLWHLRENTDSSTEAHILSLLSINVPRSPINSVFIIMLQNCLWS
jgi:hypothetical protein